jgi:hypothetical protein
MNLDKKQTHALGLMNGQQLTTWHELLEQGVEMATLVSLRDAGYVESDVSGQWWSITGRGREAWEGNTKGDHCR